MIALVDYGLGNVQAFANIYRRLGIAATCARTPEQVALADGVILPGVGSFDWAMSRFNESGLRPAVEALVVGRRRPVLGVCVGLQMMARRSQEGSLPGLGWIDADVVRFDEKVLASETHLPHMGWNDVEATSHQCLFQGLESPRFYFLHSFFVLPRDVANVLGWTDYGGRFASAIRTGNVWGTQFHPEKSHDWGIRLLRNFADLVHAAA